MENLLMKDTNIHDHFNTKQHLIQCKSLSQLGLLQKEKKYKSETIICKLNL